MRPGPDHARAIRSRLAHLDRNLTIIERIAREGEHGVLHETSPLPEPKARSIASDVAEAREKIGALSRLLGIDRDVLPGEQAIGGLCALLWETVVETHSRYLDAYGRVPDALRAILDPAADELEAVLDRMQAAVRAREST